MKVQMTTIRYIILSCAVLHNFAIDENDILPRANIENFAEMLEAAQIQPIPSNRIAANNVRATLVANYFPLLMRNVALNVNGGREDENQGTIQ